MDPRSAGPQGAGDRAPYTSPTGFRSGRKAPSRRRQALDEDLEGGVYSRITAVCHLWPSVSPWNVWDLPLAIWRQMAREVDDYRAEIAKQSKQQEAKHRG